MVYYRILHILLYMYRNTSVLACVACTPYAFQEQTIVPNKMQCHVDDAIKERIHARFTILRIECPTALSVRTAKRILKSSSLDQAESAPSERAYLKFQNTCGLLKGVCLHALFMEHEFDTGDWGGPVDCGNCARQMPEHKSQSER